MEYNYVAYMSAKKIEKELLEKGIFTLEMAKKFDELNRKSFSVHTVDKINDNSVDMLKSM